MSVKATNFVRRLRGLTITEKAVAMILADHDSHKGEGSFPGMTTVADESCLKNRQTATDVVKRLVTKGVITTDSLSRGGRGKTTVYRFNYTLTNCSPEVTVASDNCNSRIADSATKTATQTPVNCNPAEAKLQPWNPETATGELHEGVEGFMKGKEKGEKETATATLFSKERAEDLTEFVMSKASDLAPGVSFSPKQASAIRKTIETKQPTEETLTIAVREIVSANDPKYVAASLATELGARLRRQKERAEQRKKEEVLAATCADAADTWFPRTKSIPVADPDAI